MGYGAHLKEIASFLSCSLVLADASQEEKAIIRRMQNRDAFVKLNIVASLFFAVQVFFIISDLATDFYGRIDYSYLNFSAECVILLSSLAVLIFIHSHQDQESDVIRLVQLVYYLCVEIGILLYLASDMLRGLENVYNAFYNMIVLAIFAVYSLKSVIFLTLFISGGTLALILDVTGTFQWTRFQMLPLFLVLFYVCANYFRARNTERFYTQVKLEELADRFRDISNTDFLTGLPNRTALSYYIQNNVTRAVTDKKSISFLMIDIDDFKHYNDFHSHMEGDNCLRKIGKTLLGLSNEKFKAFRYGGEEFLIIGLDVASQEMLAYASRVVKAVQEQQIQREDDINDLGYVTISLGCGLAKLQKAEDYHDLLRIADQSLYQAKRQGKNCYVYQGMKYTV